MDLSKEISKTHKWFLLNLNSYYKCRQMKKLLFLIPTIIIIYFLYRKIKKKDTSLGKLNRPPKVRIVYSKKQKPSERAQITSSNKAAEILKDIWSSQMDFREEFIVLLLDRANKVLGYQLISKGGISGTIVDIRLILASAIESLASGIIIAHNHPSGNLSPSHQDKSITQKIKEAGKTMDIQLLDHIIITRDGYYSFADEGIL